MSEQDDQDPASPGPKHRRRGGRFDPKEEIPFAAGTDSESVVGKGRPGEHKGEGEPTDEEEDFVDRWDLDDPRRQKDQMAPPKDPCECYCLHCGRTFMSDQMWFQKVIGSKDGFEGFWMCPTANC